MLLILRLFVHALIGWLAAAVPAAQAPDVSGHWQGVIQAPEMMVNFAIDLARDTKGRLMGTIDLPAENIHGLPLAAVAVDGRTISFHVRADQPLTGTVSADGASIAGDMSAGGGAAPFTLTRAGEARIEAPTPQPAIATGFEGTWIGALTTRMGAMHLELTLANRDGAATARLVNVDQGRLEIPASRISQAETTLTLEFKSVGVSYEARLEADGRELSGTLRQGAGSLPMTFTRATR
jgi:hypothetical protein